MKKKIISYLFFFLLHLFFAHCLTGKTYHRAFPGIKEINPTEIKSIELRENTLVFEEKGMFFPKLNCIPLDAEHFYSYISSDFSRPCPDTEKLYFKELNNIPVYALPIPDEDNTILLLKDLDKYNHYANDATQHLKGIKIRKAYLEKKTNTIHLKSESGKCFSMARKEYSDKTTSYSVPVVDNRDICNKIENLELIEVKTMSLGGSVLVVEYQKIQEKKFYQIPIHSIPNSERKMLVRPMIGLVGETNYLYLVLFPITIPLDIVTFPLQIIYLLLDASTGASR